MNSIRRWKSWASLVLALFVCAAFDRASAQDWAAAQRPPTAQEASRFLQQATWGPTPALIERVQAVGYEYFLEEQFEAPKSSYPTLPLYPTMRPADCTNTNGDTCQRDNYSMYPLQTRFFYNALYGQDQLRQRVAFALHQIIVVSGVEITQPSWMTPYLQILDRNAFGSFHNLLYEITLNPAMGNFLDMAGNNRTSPNENYAREILQLFTIGLNQLAPDGTPLNGQNLPTYDQQTITEFARVFTGWGFAAAPAPGTPNYLGQMVVTTNRHDTGAKTLLRGVTLPPGQFPYTDLNDALNNIFLDPSVGPFISKQLIQHLVTSNPTPSYVGRVTAAFEDNGLGDRGDLRAVVKAILLDPEARNSKASTDLEKPNSAPEAGHLKHPALLIANLLRAFNAGSADGTDRSDGYLNPQAVTMGMDVFRPPSVFSYFSPFGAVPGSSLRGPEFGLLNTSTALARANFVNTMVFSRINVSANSPKGTSLNFSAIQPLAGDPAALVDSLNTLMLAGSMSAEMRDSIIQAVTAVASSNRLKRARTAVYLIATSPQYQVAR